MEDEQDRIESEIALAALKDMEAAYHRLDRAARKISIGNWTPGSTLHIRTVAPLESSVRPKEG